MYIDDEENEHWTVDIVAIKRIRNGEELLLDYGEDYWAGQGYSGTHRPKWATNVSFSK
jgi:hypothetical protein